MQKKRLAFALGVFVIHFAVSCTITLIIGWIVFNIWIPPPFHRLVKASHLLIILLAVDLVCGPLLTAILANPAKSKKELKMDFAMIIAIQLAALTYGIHAIANARPIALVFEVDRFSLVTASQINREDLSLAPAGVNSLAWKGPIYLGIRAAKNLHEKIHSIELSLQGQEPSMRPSWWQSYELSQPQIIARMRPLQDLPHRLSIMHRQNLLATLQKINRPIERTFYLPLVSSQQLESWIVLLDAKADIVGYASVNGFHSD